MPENPDFILRNVGFGSPGDGTVTPNAEHILPLDATHSIIWGLFADQYYAEVCEHSDPLHPTYGTCLALGMFDTGTHATTDVSGTVLAGPPVRIILSGGNGFFTGVSGPIVQWDGAMGLTVVGSTSVPGFSTSGDPPFVAARPDGLRWLFEYRDDWQFSAGLSGTWSPTLRNIMGLFAVDTDHYLLSGLARTILIDVTGDAPIEVATASGTGGLNQDSVDPTIFRAYGGRTVRTFTVDVVAPSITVTSTSFFSTTDAPIQWDTSSGEFGLLIGLEATGGAVVDLTLDRIDDGIALSGGSAITPPQQIARNIAPGYLLMAGGAIYQIQPLHPAGPAAALRWG